MIQPNGNRWIGTGHNAVVTDERGRDWLVYHAIDRAAPYLNEPYGINRRPMLVDPLRWDGGWPSSDGFGWTRCLRWARPGRLLFADEFTTGVGPGWTWIRQDPDAVVTGGALRWPTQAADLVGPGQHRGSAGAYPARGVLCGRGEGDDSDLGVDTVRNYQQAGLVAYAGDDDFARLSHVAIWNTRQIEFGLELPYAGRLSYGGMVEGPPAETTWLRLAHQVDPATGEHEFRAASSRDGRRRAPGGVLTFPAGPAPRIGLVSHGGDSPQATAAFDYVRVHRLQ